MNFLGFNKSSNDYKKNYNSKREDLALVTTLDDNTRLALEAGIHIARKRKGLAKPINEREVILLFENYAEAGLELLKKRWDKKVGIQIQDDICQIIQS